MKGADLIQFLLAPDSYKESMSAKNAALAMETGVKRVFPNAKCTVVPMADGGEGTVETLVDATNGKIMEVEVVGPLGKKVNASYGMSGDGYTAFIEVSSASGIHLVNPEDRNPWITTSYGIGEIIKDVLERGVKQVVIGVGGSVTNDGGLGMLQALGVSFKDANDQELAYGGGALGNLETIDMTGLDQRLSSVKFEIAYDVSNPLVGKNGASYIFGPQKGATPEMVEQLDQNLAHFADVIRHHLGKEITNTSGAGAAGGLSGGLLAFLNAELKKGIDLVIDYTNLEQRIVDCDYVFTGEGSIDGQTLSGKTPYGVATMAMKHQVPTIAFAGRIGKNVDALYDHGFTAIVGILKELTSIEEALQLGEDNLTEAVETVCRIIRSQH